jgi:hypothetical protein
VNRTSLRDLGWLLVPAAAGIVLRCFNLLSQVLGGDEMHAVRQAVQMPLGRILVTYKPSDNCIPLTALYRAAMDLGLTVSEIHLRLPILLAGFAALIAIPWWALGRLGSVPRLAGSRRAAAQVLGWLLALSPLLVHYGRLVRSYMPVVLLGFLATAAFERWYRLRDRRSAAAYVICGALAVYFHLVAAPFVLSPFLFAAGARLLRPRDAPSWRQLFYLGGAIVLSFLVFLGPALESLVQLISLKHDPLQLTSQTWTAVTRLQAGTGVTILVVLFWLSAARGFLVLLRHQRALAIYALVLVAGQVAGLLILSPTAMHQGPIMSRYLLVTLPWVLLAVAVGWTAPWKRLPGSVSIALSRGLPVLLLAALFAAGPLSSREFRTSPFQLRPESLLFYWDRAPRPGPVLGVYRAFRPENPGRVIEYPWHTTWRYTSAVVDYQRAHGRGVIVAPAEKLLWDRRLGFRNMVAARRESLLATDAAYLVVHLNWQSEMAVRDRRRPPKAGSALAHDLEVRRRDFARMSRQAAGRVEVLTEHWGPPDLRARGIMVWDLNRVRRQRAEPSAGSLRDSP